MKSILEIIKERAKWCAERGRMFTMPAEVEKFVVEHRDYGGDGDYWRLEDGAQWLTVESSSRDGSRVFQINPDRSSIVVKGKILVEVSYSDAWDERV